MRLRKFIRLTQEITERVSEWLDSPALNETVHEDYLYHGTRLSAFLKIMRTNTLKSTTTPKTLVNPRTEVVSLTRNPRLAMVRANDHEWQRERGAVLVLDRTRLKHKYRIVPVDEFRHRTSGWNEAEERVSEAIHPPEKYLVHVIQSPGARKELEQQPKLFAKIRHLTR